MELRTLNNQDGIALGPILFIIAILAIIAAAIAAGSGSFTANTKTVNTNVRASTLIQQGETLANNFQALLTNEISYTSITFDTWPTTGMFAKAAPPRY